MSRLIFLCLAVFLAACGGQPPPRITSPAPTLPPGAQLPVTPQPNTVRPPPSSHPPPPLSGSRIDPKIALSDMLVPAIDGPALELHMINIGQGDGLLLKTPGGRFVLLDSGPSRATEGLIDYLDAQGIKAFALTIQSHPHADHIAGTPAVMDRWPVKLTLDPGFIHPTPQYQNLLQAVRRNKVPISLARDSATAKDCHVDGPHHPQCRTVTVEEGVTFEVLGPNVPFLSGTRSDPNSNSIIVRLDYQGMSFLFTGDAELESEDRLLRTHPDRLKATILKVAHHGSAHATQPSFLRAAQPRLALVSCSKTNSYGHPAPETMERLSAAGIPTLVTAELGHIVLRTDGTALQITTQAPDGTIRNLAQEPALPVVKAYDPPLININTANARMLTGLPRIGRKTAERIIADRQANGRFQSIDELVRVKGIGKARLRALRHRLTINDAPAGDVKTAQTQLPIEGGLDLNQATAADLKGLPGIGRKTAARILEWRKKNGGFQSVDELRKVKGIGKKKLQKIRPHVHVRPAS